MSEMNSECCPGWAHLYHASCPGVFVEVALEDECGREDRPSNPSVTCFSSSSAATASGSASSVKMPTFGAPEQLLDLKQASPESELLRARGSAGCPR